MPAPAEASAGDGVAAGSGAAAPLGDPENEAGQITVIDVIADPGRLRQLRLAVLPD